MLRSLSSSPFDTSTHTKTIIIMLALSSFFTSTRGITNIQIKQAAFLFFSTLYYNLDIIILVFCPVVVRIAAMLFSIVNYYN